jgi:hypothetical protein
MGKETYVYREGDNLKDPGVDEMIILTWILEK